MKNKRDENSSMPHKCTNHTERMIGEGETRMVINSISYKTFCFPRRKKMHCLLVFVFSPSLSLIAYANVIYGLITRCCIMCNSCS